MPEASRRYDVTAKRSRVPHRSIKAGGHQHNVGRELPRDRHHDGSESRQVFGVAQGRTEPAGPRDVHVVAETRVGSTLRRSAGAGEEVSVVVPVDGQIQNARIVVEDLLGSVAVVDVLKTKRK